MKNVISIFIFLLSSMLYVSAQKIGISSEHELKDVVPAKSVTSNSIGELKDASTLISGSSLEIAPSDAYVDKLDSLLLESRKDESILYLDTSISNVYNQTTEFSEQEYKSKMEQIDGNSPFNLEYNKRVKQSIDFYLHRHGRDNITAIIGRSELFFPMMEEILIENGLPIEFKYLAIIESALKPTARSRAGATGLWQFMYGTAKENGLKIDSYVDERKDPIKSTQAACKYLNRLYKIYGDWNLVLAAYNSGPGNVNKAIRRSGGKRDYWDIRSFLPRETRGYVPNFIAANFVFHYNEELNILPVKPRYTYAEVDTILIKKRVTFSQIRSFVNIPLDELEYLNPVYYKSIIPVSDNSNYLILPSDLVGDFIANEKNIYRYSPSPVHHDIASTKYVSEYYYKVKSGDVLGRIADRNGVGLSQLRSWNNIRGNRIYPGQRLLIRSTKARSKTYASKSVSAPHTLTSSSKVYHVVRQGDTLWDIAKIYPNVSVSDIKRRNRHLNFKNLKLGSKILISG